MIDRRKLRRRFGTRTSRRQGTKRRIVGKKVLRPRTKLKLLISQILREEAAAA